MFSTLPKVYFKFLFIIILSSANAFSLEQSEILAVGEELTHSAEYGDLKEGQLEKKMWDREKHR